MTTVLSIALVVISITLFAVAMATLWWMLHAWRDPETLLATGFLGEADPPQMSFSLLVPARHEQAVLEATLEQLLRLDHPDFEVLPIVGHDDPETAAVAEAVARRHPEQVRIVVDRSWPKNKPKALNAALAQCRGDVVGVFDAEDEVDRRLLRSVDRTFRTARADVVQGGVQLVNFRSSWYSLRNCLEYFFWFRSRLHLQSEHRFIPLGGNTVFARTELLRQVGGWDEACLAEDCELGVRLSAMGAKICVAYDPYLVTREETPDSLWALLKQRTRWNQGFLQVLRKREWRSLPLRRQRMLARYTLAQPFLQAFSGIAIPIAVLCALVLQVPVGVALLSFVPAVPTIAMLVFEVVGLREFCRVYYVRPRLRDYARLVIGTPFYQVLLAVAALRAVARELRGERGWEKTAHKGAHREATGASGARELARYDRAAPQYETANP
ncbi:MAG TPA: glycosyltransferase [Solirubrobacteraceae bacterium]|jgi:cellulose synthase/poly-beta-1,6-N-acetylglucosamine synthase-like glycosyltransferase|nr:glycosyltransferase [Solirubrobacteraceae bacterium]